MDKSGRIKKALESVRGKLTRTGYKVALRENLRNLKTSKDHKILTKELRLKFREKLLERGKVGKAKVNSVVAKPRGSRGRSLG